MDSNTQQHIPPLFKEIVRNDNERAALKALPVIDFFKGAELIKERRSYTRAAERALQWNTDKGNRQ